MAIERKIIFSPHVFLSDTPCFVLVVHKNEILAHLNQPRAVKTMFFFYHEQANTPLDAVTQSEPVDKTN